jgi:signal transduction histidine kinase/CheY-like chemotaxis protein
VNAKAGQLLNRKPADLFGKHIFTEFPGGNYRKQFEKSLAEQTYVCLEEYYAPIGKWFETRVYPSADGVSVYFHDVTERRLDEERQRQSEKLTAIGHLAGGVAHDFNNQLAVILGYAGLLENRLTDPETKRFASAILRAANRSGDLTRNLLAFSRQGHYENVPVDLHELIIEVCDLLSHSLEKRIEVIRELDAPRAVVMGDPATLQNALLNLALNARDAMPNGGLLVFRTSALERPMMGNGPGTLPWHRDLDDLPAGVWFHVEVRDTGTGMSDEARRHVFEPFFTTKPVGKGTGLGLASVFGTVKTHGGRITLESAPGRGTVFHLAFPAAAAAAEDARSPHGAPSTRSLKVLVVDDDAPVREIMKDMLRESGHVVREAGGGREALEIFRASADIDLVILDLMMADMDGSATFAELALIRPQVPVVLSTGYPGDAKIPALMEAGVRGLLQKPYEKSQLDRMIAAVMA